MEQVHRLRRDGTLSLQPPEKIGLRLLGRAIEADASRDFLGEKFAKLPQFNQAGIRIIPEIPLRKSAKAIKLRLVSPQKIKIMGFMLSCHLF
jgi:hypothetical protein